MKKLQIFLISAALACAAFAQNNPAQAPASEKPAPAAKAITAKNDENFPKEITENLSPLMKKVKDEIWGGYPVLMAREHSITAGYENNALLFFCGYPDGSLFLGVFFKVPEELEKHAADMANFLNKDSLEYPDFRHFKNMAYENEGGFMEIRAFINIPKADNAMSPGEFKKYFEIQKRYADWATSYAALFELRFTGADSASIMDAQRYANLPLKFLRVLNLEKPIYAIQYEADGRNIFFYENRIAVDVPKDMEVFNFKTLLENTKGQDVKNLKTGETTIGGVKYKTISCETKLEGAERAECLYITNALMFETSTPFPRTPEAQKIIDEMIEKRAADKMPFFRPNPQAAAPEQKEKAPQAPNVSE